MHFTSVFAAAVALVASVDANRSTDLLCLTPCGQEQEKRHSGDNNNAISNYDGSSQFSAAATKSYSDLSMQLCGQTSYDDNYVHNYPSAQIVDYHFNYDQHNYIHNDKHSYDDDYDDYYYKGRPPSSGIVGTSFAAGSYQVAVYPGFSHAFSVAPDGRISSPDGYILGQQTSSSSTNLIHMIEYDYFAAPPFTDSRYSLLTCEGVQPGADGLATALRCWNSQRPPRRDFLQLCPLNERSDGYETVYLGPVRREDCVDSALLVTPV
ncbi:hypothetical protein Slin14017_G042140 [Septoria linicola]|nr:hypothetical protein Slin14017_G042140 [Septoria linicola]